ncbi:MAG: ketoacyl-ACP synthase III [Opitutales bacterium]|nr:ketoacyl-ACP synthase III [Opitutales bacterium]
MTVEKASSVIIKGVGSYAPPHVLTNDDLSKIVDTSDEWIRTRTGIRERRIAKDETTSDMATKAAQEAMRNAGVEPSEIDLLIVATVTGDHPFPSTSCVTQHKLGLRKIPCFDLLAACSGFLYSIDTAKALMLSGGYKKALIIGAEKLSGITDWDDRGTCVLFGDGAGAAVLELIDEPGCGIIAGDMGADGSEREILFVPAGGSERPASEKTIADREHFIKMQGNQVFKNAVVAMGRSAKKTLEKAGISADEVACVVPHQANIRIIEAISNRLGIGIERFKINLDRFGNTSAASIPIALDEAMRNSRFKSGDYILLVAFGAGLTWASTLIRWQ